MAKVAKQWLVWQSEPKLDSNGRPILNEFGNLMSDRIEVAMDSVVPDTVPIEIQKDWEDRGLIFEDPTKEHVEKQEGPPNILLPPVLSQRIDHMRRGAGPRGIPPRPVPKEV